MVFKLVFSDKKRKSPITIPELKNRIENIIVQIVEKDLNLLDIEVFPEKLFQIIVEKSKQKGYFHKIVKNILLTIYKKGLFEQNTYSAFEEAIRKNSEKFVHLFRPIKATADEDILNYLHNDASESYQVEFRMFIVFWWYLVGWWNELSEQTKDKVIDLISKDFFGTFLPVDKKIKYLFFYCVIPDMKEKLLPRVVMNAEWVDEFLKKNIFDTSESEKSTTKKTQSVPSHFVQDLFYQWVISVANNTSEISDQIILKLLFTPQFPSLLSYCIKNDQIEVCERLLKNIISAWIYRENYSFIRAYNDLFKEYFKPSTTLLRIMFSYFKKTFGEIWELSKTLPNKNIESLLLRIWSLYIGYAYEYSQTSVELLTKPNLFTNPNDPGSEIDDPQLREVFKKYYDLLNMAEEVETTITNYHKSLVGVTSTYDQEKQGMAVVRIPVDDIKKTLADPTLQSNLMNSIKQWRKKAEETADPVLVDSVLLSIFMAAENRVQEYLYREYRFYYNSYYLSSYPFVINRAVWLKPCQDVFTDPLIKQTIQYSVLMNTIKTNFVFDPEHETLKALDPYISKLMDYAYRGSNNDIHRLIKRIWETPLSNIYNIADYSEISYETMCVVADILCKPPIFENILSDKEFLKSKSTTKECATYFTLALTKASEDIGEFVKYIHQWYTAGAEPPDRRSPYDDTYQPVALTVLDNLPPEKFQFYWPLLWKLMDLYPTSRKDEMSFYQVWIKKLNQTLQQTPNTFFEIWNKKFKPYIKEITKDFATLLLTSLPCKISVRFGQLDPWFQQLNQLVAENQTSELFKQVLTDLWNGVLDNLEDYLLDASKLNWLRDDQDKLIRSDEQARIEHLYDTGELVAKVLRYMVHDNPQVQARIDALAEKCRKYWSSQDAMPVLKSIPIMMSSNVSWEDLGLVIDDVFYDGNEDPVPFKLKYANEMRSILNEKFVEEFLNLPDDQFYSLLVKYPSLKNVIVYELYMACVANPNKTKQKVIAEKLIRAPREVFDKVVPVVLSSLSAYVNVWGNYDSGPEPEIWKLYGVYFASVSPDMIKNLKKYDSLIHGYIHSLIANLNNENTVNELKNFLINFLIPTMSEFPFFSLRDIIYGHGHIFVKIVPEFSLKLSSDLYKRLIDAFSVAFTNITNINDSIFRSKDFKYFSEFVKTHNLEEHVEVRVRRNLSNWSIEVFIKILFFDVVFNLPDLAKDFINHLVMGCSWYAYECEDQTLSVGSLGSTIAAYYPVLNQYMSKLIEHLQTYYQIILQNSYLFYVMVSTIIHYSSDTNGERFSIGFIKFLLCFNRKLYSINQFSALNNFSKESIRTWVYQYVKSVPNGPFVDDLSKFVQWLFGEEEIPEQNQTEQEQQQETTSSDAEQNPQPEPNQNVQQNIEDSGSPNQDEQEQKEVEKDPNQENSAEE